MLLEATKERENYQEATEGDVQAKCETHLHASPTKNGKT
jgi:hypothetical protein